MDAGAFGCRLGPRDAYRFARGEEITASSSQPAKLSRPLEFLVVADHSDGFGFFPQLMSGDPELLHRRVSLEGCGHTGSAGLSGGLLQRKTEGRAFAEGRIDPNPAAMALDNLLADSEPNPGTRILIGRMQSVEEPE